MWRHWRTIGASWGFWWLYGDSKIIYSRCAGRRCALLTHNHLRAMPAGLEAHTTFRMSAGTHTDQFLGVTAAVRTRDTMGIVAWPSATQGDEFARIDVGRAFATVDAALQPTRDVVPLNSQYGLSHTLHRGVIRPLAIGSYSCKRACARKSCKGQHEGHQ